MSMTRIVTALTRSLVALVVVAVAGSSQPAQGAGFLLFEQSGRGWAAHTPAKARSLPMPPRSTTTPPA